MTEEERKRDAAAAESAIKDLQLQIKSKTGDLSISLILVIKSVGQQRFTFIERLNRSIIDIHKYINNIKRHLIKICKNILDNKALYTIHEIMLRVPCIYGRS